MFDDLYANAVPIHLYFTNSLIIRTNIFYILKRVYEAGQLLFRCGQKCTLQKPFP